MLSHLAMNISRLPAMTANLHSLQHEAFTAALLPTTASLTSDASCTALLLTMLCTRKFSTRARGVPGAVQPAEAVRDRIHGPQQVTLKPQTWRAAQHATVNTIMLHSIHGATTATPMLVQNGINGRTLSRLCKADNC